MPRQSYIYYWKSLTPPNNLTMNLHSTVYVLLSALFLYTFSFPQFFKWHINYYYYCLNYTYFCHSFVDTGTPGTRAARRHQKDTKRIPDFLKTEQKQQVSTQSPNCPAKQMHTLREHPHSSVFVSKLKKKK